MLQASFIRKTAWAVVALGGTTLAQAQAPDKAAAYYHYSLGHMYADLASINGSADYIKKAIENYKLAIKEDPQTPMLSEELSELYIQTGRLREAQSDAEEALKANPSDVNAHRMLGRIYTRQMVIARSARSTNRCCASRLRNIRRSPNWTRKTWIPG